ncbi:putative bifunctional diguanylate cyclase/phosphodiesterase [Sphingomonas sp. MMS24-J13]|uniref:putative bifunctional diguanylate cyclase/phosphodiesterase n=1 Tax=Sphingomonas sp. MMS24-J13 TaxID=3238686 RepID=UPI00384D84EB
MLLELQNLVLELMATGVPLAQTTRTLCGEVERLVPDAFCSVLTIDSEGRLHTIAAPSLPADFCSAIEGTPIGPDTGSCGTAAWRGEPVAVLDIATDPLWADYRHLAAPHGIRACWSSPIWDQHGKVVGTFAFYYRHHRGPTELERNIVAASVHLCSLAIERDDQLNEAHRLIYTDALTGLGNRACFNDVAARYDPPDSGRWGLLLIDVDGLKVVNDTFGHRAGDRLIRIVADRISDVAAGMPVFRLGGDEIAVMLSSDDRAQAEQTAVAILRALEAPAECDGHMLAPTATIGIAVRGSPHESSETVRQNADMALYHAKETQRGGFVHHVDGLGTAITRRMTAILDMRAALDEDRIVPFYQPMVELVSQRVVGLEALYRIRRSDGSLGSAGDFQAATADAHVAKALTRRMLERIAADARRWAERGVDFRLISINLPPADFHSGGIADRVAQAFDAVGVPLTSVMIEVTELVYLSRRDDMVSREIAALRDYGIRIALDDFGTGYASLSHLLTVPIDVIKIDRSFVEQLDHDRGSAAIINGVARIAEKLGLDVVAEGVETEEQCKILLSLGCHVGQGFHLAAPMDQAATKSFLTERAGAQMPIGPHLREERSVWPIRSVI